MKVNWEALVTWIFIILVSLGIFAVLIAWMYEVYQGFKHIMQ